MPAAYVEEMAPEPAPVQRPPPPQPPRRPPAARKPANLQAQPARDSVISNGASGSDQSRSTTPTPNLGNSLADALLARKNAMRQREDDDDW